MSQSPDLDRIKSHFQKTGEEPFPYVEFPQEQTKPPLSGARARTVSLPPPSRNPPLPSRESLLPRIATGEWAALDRAIGKGRSLQRQSEQHWPCVLVTGSAGGTGKTLLAASLAAQWSLSGRPVVLLDLNASSFLSFLFLGKKKTESVRAGKIWTTYARPGEAIPLLSVRFQSPLSGSGGTECAFSDLYHEIRLEAPSLFPLSPRTLPLILVDMPLYPPSLIEEAAGMSPLVLLPTLPEIPSLLAAKEMENFFERTEADRGLYFERYYILNRINENRPLHQNLAARFQWLLGSRLCPVTIAENPAMEDLLANGHSFLNLPTENQAPVLSDRIARWVMEKSDVLSRHEASRAG